jgi:recombination protein RecR
VLPQRVSQLVEHLSRLPGVGEKSAYRFAVFLVTSNSEIAINLGKALIQLHESVRPCSICGFLAEVVPGEDVIRCTICKDTQRDNQVLCIVARIQDLLAIERTGSMRGRYFILPKLLSPLDGVGPDDLPLEELKTRINDEKVREIIVATPPTVDGEATALLIAKELSGLNGVQVSRIASGVPHGGDLEYADQITLGRALEGRHLLQEGESTSWAPKKSSLRIEHRQLLVLIRKRFALDKRSI